MATWLDVKNNIAAGGVVLENNEVFNINTIFGSNVHGYYFSYAPFFAPEINLTDNDHQNNFKTIKFKDGSFYGICQGESRDSIEIFYYIEGYEGETTTTYCGLTVHRKFLMTTPRYVEMSGTDSGGLSYTYYCKPSKIMLSLCYNEFLDPTMSVIYEFPIITHAINIDVTVPDDPDFQIQYSSSFTIPDDAMAPFGSFFEAAEWKDFLAGHSSGLPNYPGDAGGAGGGNGTYYAPNEGVPFSEVPLLQLINLGFNTIYNPDPGDVQDIARWLWSDDYTENIKMNHASPMENIITLAACPILRSKLVTTPSSFKIGNVTLNNKIVRKIANQYVKLSCGSRYFKGYWNGFLDYNSTYNLYLPFIGFRSIRSDDIVNNEVAILYKIDLMSGDGVCEVSCTPVDPETGEYDVSSVLYSFACNIYYNMATSGANYTSMYAQQRSAVASGISNIVNSAGRMLSGDLLGGALQLFTGQTAAKTDYETAKPDYTHGGNSSGNSGFFSVRNPYVIQTLPITNLPDDYAKMHGIPSMIFERLQDLHGYTEINAINLDSINASSAEKSELMNIMKSGFYI